jgi:excisionase family DNA binding protein
MPDALLTLPDAAAQLAISRRTLEREIASGRIAAVRLTDGLGSVVENAAQNNCKKFLTIV